MTNKWDYQAAAGTAVHYILQRYFTKDESTGKILGDSERNTIIDEINKTIENDLKEDLGSRYREGLYNEETIKDAITYADLLKTQLRKLHGENCEFYPELGVSAKMHNIPSDKPGVLMGYIDLAVLGENGRINYYDYKTSPKEYADFGSAKKLAYTYQLAAYGKLFRQYGLDYRDSDVGILPL
jgi:ATP-dependent exoDNAse (exonuclease V) beta subunit